MAASGKKSTNMLRKLKKEFDETKQSLHRLREKFADDLGEALEPEAALREARIAAGLDPGQPEFTKESTDTTKPTPKPVQPAARICSKRKAEIDLDDKDSSKRLKCDVPAQEPIKVAEKPTAKRKAGILDDAETGPRKKAKQESYHPVGLTNHKQACFSNVVIQMLSAATSAEHLDALFGRPSKAERFGTTSASLGRLGKSSRLSTRRLGGEREKLRSAVKDAAAAGETDKVSVTKHLRLLLQDMKTTKKDEAACPYLFQTVLAFGGLSEADQAREEVSGDSQEDCHEYFTTVLSALEADASAPNSTGVSALFELETEAQDVCQSGCGHQTTPEVSKNNYHSVSVPLHTDEEALGLQGLLETSLKSESDRLCTGCKTSTIRRASTVQSAPEALVVKVDRLSFDRKKKRVLKSKVKINFFSSDDVEVDHHQYQLSAVVMHDGMTPQRGHYTMFRRDGNAWSFMNDDKVTSVSQNQVNDGMKCGQSAMLLLKKISKA